MKSIKEFNGKVAAADGTGGSFAAVFYLRIR